MTAARARRLGPVLAAGLVGCVAADAGAASGPATDAWDDVAAGPLDAHALIDVYLLHVVAATPSGHTTLRQFDLAADAPALEWLRLTLAHRPTPFGARVDVGMGDTAEVFRLEDPERALHPRLARALSFVEQAFVTVELPVGRGLFVDAGKFESPAGFEDNATVDNWSYSRSFLFSWAEPSLHTGVRASMQLSRTVSASLLWVNGWNANWLDGDDLRSFAAAVAVRPRRWLDLALTYLGGLERSPTAPAEPALHWRDLLTASCAWSAASWLTLALAADYGDDRARGGVRFGGVAGYVRARAARWLSASVRGEYYADPSGFTTGTPQSLGEVTATLDLHHSDGAAHLWLRLEYRHDQSSARPFPTASGPIATQDTLTLGLSAAVARRQRGRNRDAPAEPAPATPPTR